MVYYGIVSPCSTCLNYKSDPKPGDYRRSCPRRDAKEIWDKGEDGGVYHLYQITSGTEDPHVLTNPVHVEGKQVVWCARRDDNLGVPGIPGSSLNDVQFDTTYIHCHPYPYVSREHKSIRHTHGELQEWDTVLMQDVDTKWLSKEGDYKVQGVVERTNPLDSRTDGIRVPLLTPGT